MFYQGENKPLLKEYICKNGKREGPYKSYYYDGQLEEEKTYKDDKEDGPSCLGADPGALFFYGCGSCRHHCPP